MIFSKVMTIEISLNEGPPVRFREYGNYHSELTAMLILKGDIGEIYVVELEDCMPVANGQKRPAIELAYNNNSHKILGRPERKRIGYGNMSYVISELSASDRIGKHIPFLNAMLKRMVDDEIIKLVKK